MAGYSGTPLAKKLGVRQESRVALVDAPEGFEQTLGPLPPGARLVRGLRGRPDLVLAFVRSLADLERRFEAVTRSGAPVWFVWPKRSSRIESNVREQALRDYALPRGWVDHKVAAVDETWSGLRFARRR